MSEPPQPVMLRKESVDSFHQAVRVLHGIRCERDQRQRRCIENWLNQRILNGERTAGRVVGLLEQRPANLSIALALPVKQEKRECKLISRGSFFACFKTNAASSALPSQPC